MRNTFLVFKRDYLGYVQAWGFWLSIASLPFLMALGLGFGLLAAKWNTVFFKLRTNYKLQAKVRRPSSPDMISVLGAFRLQDALDHTRFKVG